MIIVIGTGIIGLYSAYDLLRSGFKVTILDFNMKATASSASVGMLAPIIETKPMEKELFELMLESKTLWDDFLNTEKGKNIGLRNNSSLLISMNSDDHERILFKKNFFEKLNYRSKLLTAEETLKLEPSLNSNIHSSLLCENQNQVNPNLLKNFLINEIIRLKGKVLKVKKIDKISFKNNQLIFANQYIEADKIIISCGVWSGKLIENSFKLRLPIRPLKGISMHIKASHLNFKNNLWFRNIYVAQRSNNVLAVGATEDEKGFENSVNLDEAYFLTKSLWECFSDIEKIKFLKFLPGLRPSMIDGYPVIGPLKKISDDIYCNFGHYRHGILLAPISSKMILSYISKKKINKSFDFFSPNRFNF